MPWSSSGTFPGPERANLLKRTGRSVEFLGLLGAGLLVSTFLSGAATNTASRPVWVDGGAIGISLVVSCSQFVLAYRVLTPAVVKTRDLLIGGVVAGVGWTVLQAVGTYLVGHELRNSAVYGAFAFVLGLVFWISLVTRLVVYTSELNVVLARRLWPRSLVQPPLTRADREVLAAEVEQNRRRPEQQVLVTFDVPDAAAEASPAPDRTAALNGESPPAPSSAPREAPSLPGARQPSPGRRGASSPGHG